MQYLLQVSIVFILTHALPVRGAWNEVAGRCSTPLGDLGVCVPLQHCPHMQEYFERPYSSVRMRYIFGLQRMCARPKSSDNFLVVCCPQASSNANVEIVQQTIVEVKEANENVKREKHNLPGCPMTRADTERTAWLNVGSPCTGPLLEKGTCKPMKECGLLLTQLEENRMDRALISYLQLSNKLCDRIDTNVCCPFDLKLESNDVSPQESQPSAVSCRLPQGEAGTCTPIRECAAIQSVLPRFSVDWAQQYITMLQMSCGNSRTVDSSMKICCIDVETEPETPMEAQAFRILADERQHHNHRRPEFIQARTLGSSCRGPRNEVGVCESLTSCPILWNKVLNEPLTEAYKLYLRSSRHLCGSKGINVCCPNEDIPEPDLDSVPTGFLTEAEGCGVQDRYLFEIGAVIGGEISHVGAWPWIALLGYTSKKVTHFNCGGVLITARHVLTAAHCIRSDLTTVRLGEFDLTLDNETMHEDILVRKVVRHPQYQRDGRNDLAILFLERSVAISIFITPICMPTSNQLRFKSYVGTEPFVAGWGLTKENGVSSDLLRDVPVPIHDNSVCQDIYSRNKMLLSRDQFDNSVICAGAVLGEKDSCKGDSGGPLMIEEDYENEKRFYLLGTVSYGIGCGRAPGVYMKVQYFIDWILQTIAEN